MDKSFYFKTLYPLQDQVLQLLSTLETELYLSGGTAASRGYLHHRFSDDLDLFVNDRAEFTLWTGRLIQALSETPAWKLEVTLREPRFVRVNLIDQQATLKIEMINDVPSHIGDLQIHPVLGRMDSPENILANKITALVDREEPKDMADIWGFCCQLGLSLSKALEDAGSKAAGIFPAEVARRLCTATHDDWRLVRWIEAPDRDEFLSDLLKLGEGLILG